eukprot:7703482-Lingulodinium_polyedra.AAC.1
MPEHKLHRSPGQSPSGYDCMLLAPAHRLDGRGRETPSSRPSQPENSAAERPWGAWFPSWEPGE